MNYRLFVFLVFILMLLSSCMSRRTRQFIVPEEIGITEVTAGGWILTPPRVVAFKDMIKLDDIKDTTMFWITLEAKHRQSEEQPVNSDLLIDSVMVSFIGFDSAYWRKPTRVAPFGQESWKYACKAFNFFGDQGVVIPMNVDSIYLDFTAVVLDKTDSSVVKYPVHFTLVREEKALKVPFLRE